jgi:hypothetical protein
VQDYFRVLPIVTDAHRVGSKLDKFQSGRETFALRLKCLQRAGERVDVHRKSPWWVACALSRVGIR